MALYPAIARIQVPHRGFPSRPRGLPCTRSAEASLWHVRTSFNDLQPSNSSKGQVPAIAMFASFSRYKREAFRHSQFAPTALNDAGIPVIMKVSRAKHKCPNQTLNLLQSDHPGIVSRWLLHEAQQAHYYGLPEAVALSSVISTPAQTLGLDHRIGFIKTGEPFVRVGFHHN